MFSKTRRSIVFALMGGLILFLTLTLAAIIVSSNLSTKRQNQEMLSNYVASYRLNGRPEDDLEPPELPDDPDDRDDWDDSDDRDDYPAPGGMRDRPRDQDMFRLSSFYSVAFSESGEVLASDAGNNDLYSEEEITALAEEVRESGKATGKKGTLLFETAERDGYFLVAFLDTTVTQNSMDRVLRITLITGVFGVLVLAAASVFTARAIVRPLEENDRKQKQFISDAGHELKTPVAVISTNAELLSRQIGKNEWLSNIQYENERMGGLVTELLSLSRAENAAFVPEEVDFSRLVTQEILPFESVAFEQGLTLRSTITEGLCVLGNPGQLCQLVSILTDNAISHSTGGDSVDVALTAEHKHAVLQVSNHGEEIPEDQRSRLFERFYRLDTARTGGSGHYGLGLPIAKAITEAHKGKISIGCADGIVTFTVQLPLEK